MRIIVAIGLIAVQISGVDAGTALQVKANSGGGSGLCSGYCDYTGRLTPVSFTNQAVTTQWEKQCVDTSGTETGAVRCCFDDANDDPLFLSVCSASSNYQTISSDLVTYAAAVAECAAHGLQLCTLQQLTTCDGGSCTVSSGDRTADHGACCSGCGLDDDYVWSRDECDCVSTCTEDCAWSNNGVCGDGVCVLRIPTRAVAEPPRCRYSCLSRVARSNLVLTGPRRRLRLLRLPRQRLHRLRTTLRSSGHRNVQ